MLACTADLDPPHTGLGRANGGLLDTVDQHAGRGSTSDVVLGHVEAHFEGALRWVPVAGGGTSSSLAATCDSMVQEVEDGTLLPREGKRFWILWVCLVPTKFPNFPSHPSHLLSHRYIKYSK